MGNDNIEPDSHKGGERARNMGWALKAKRLGHRTHCNVDGKGHTCSHENRLCNALTLIMAKTGKQTKCEVILIGEKLGY